MSKKETFNNSAVKPLRIGQWGVGHSHGVPLRSENFTTCICLLILNLEKQNDPGTDYMQMHHVVGGCLQDEQRAAMKEFSRQPGRKMAIAVEGSRAYPLDSYRDDLQDCGISFLQAWPVKTGSEYWHIDVLPEKGEVTVTSELPAKTFYPFPERYDAPAEVRGLSMEDRLTVLLRRQGTTSDGLLTEDMRNALQNFMEKVSGEDPNNGYRPLMSRLFDDYTLERARQAGFSDWTDYMEADRHNFTRIPAGSPEWALRALHAGEAGLERFAREGIDLKNYPIKPEDVVALFKGRLHLLDRFICNPKNNTAMSPAISYKF